jgi:hypothetical protein
LLHSSMSQVAAYLNELVDIAVQQLETETLRSCLFQ